MLLSNDPLPLSYLMLTFALVLLIQFNDIIGDAIFERFASDEEFLPTDEGEVLQITHEQRKFTVIRGGRFDEKVFK